MKFLLLIAFILVSAPIDATSTDEVNPPWQWSDDQRARARLDPTLRAKRVEVDLQRRAARGRGLRASERPPADVIDGRLHPELFFPGELFEHLVYTAFVSLPDVYPRVVRQESVDLFRDLSEWQRFEEITVDFAAILRRERDFINQAARTPRANPIENDGSLQELRQQKCSAKAAALRVVRMTFGRERFDRMLYEVVAPPISRSYVSAVTLERSVIAARRFEEDCR